MRRCSRCDVDGDRNRGLKMGAGRVGMTRGLAFEPHEKHMYKESRSCARARTAADAAFYTHPNANVFRRLVQFMLLQPSAPTLRKTPTCPALHLYHVGALSSPTHSHI